MEKRDGTRPIELLVIAIGIILKFMKAGAA